MSGNAGSTDSVPPSVPSRLVLALAVYPILGGALTLLGWALDIPRLIDWGGLGISMKPNAAICALALGLALALNARGPSRRSGARMLALLATALGCLTLVEHVGTVNLGIDTLLFNEPAGRPATAAPGRMGVPASLSFTILGAVIFFSVYDRGRRWGATVALVPLAIVLFALLGYLYGASQLYSVARFTGIALQTASMIAILGIGTIASLPERGLADALKGEAPGAVILRRVFVAILVFPIVVGWLRLRGQELGLYDAPFGTAARTWVEILALGGLLWWAARGISRQARAAQEREALLRTVTTEARVGMVLVNEDRRYLFANAMYAEVLGLADANIVGKRVQDVLGPLYEQVGPRLDVAFRGERIRYELRQGAHPATGQEHVYDVSYEPRSVGAGESHVVVVISDVTARKAAEVELREADRKKDEFLATLAHELRNPLAPMRNGLEIARRSGDAATVTRLLGMMDRQLTHMVRLVDDLLDVSRISRGKLDLQRAPTDLAKVIDSAVETARPLITAHAHELVLHLPAVPITINGDFTRLVQVFANLLNNAAKYTPRGGRIDITVDRQGADAVIRVRDNGVGIPADIAPTVFDTFTQGKRAIERAGGGLGIGLTLVRRLVEMHGGGVTIESPPAGRDSSDSRGPGSELIVRLPAVFDTVAASPDSGAASAPERSQRGLRVLVADDNIDALDSLTMLLQDMGHDVRSARDGEEALEGATAFRPHVAVLDIGMPKLDGNDVARRIRGEAWGKDIVLIALTGWGQSADRLRSKDAGFDHHLVKPLQIDLLEEFLAERT
ncbi:MAG: ATP-binding protein [Myxococcales bacterium]